jgi:hypothetical protein
MKLLQWLGLVLICGFFSGLFAEELGLTNYRLFDGQTNWLHVLGHAAIFGVLYFSVFSLVNRFGLADYTFSGVRLVKKRPSVSLPNSEPSSDQSHDQAQTK